MRQPLVWFVEDPGNDRRLLWWNLYQGRYLAEVHAEGKQGTMLVFDLNNHDAIVASLTVTKSPSHHTSVSATHILWLQLADRLVGERRELSASF